MMKIGLIREGKIPPDARVALTPKHCSTIKKQYPDIQIVVEPSPHRRFSDADYEAEGIEVTTHLSDCDILIGIKEVPVAQLLPDKTYFFFSHTIKKQPHNRKLLQAILEKNIKLIDYEMLTDDNGKRLIAFGQFAGMVGAHNGILGYGLRTGQFTLPRMKDLVSFSEMVNKFYTALQLPPMKIVLTGHGRVANGAIEVLKAMDIEQVSPQDFIQNNDKRTVFTQLKPIDYVAHKEGKPYDKYEFYAHGDRYYSIFAPYYRAADIFINCIYYDEKAPMFFNNEDMTRRDFNIKMIADVSCDLVPHSSVPSTIRTTTIANPFFGYHPATQSECEPFATEGVTMMTIDNLPNELSRDASEFFGNQFIEHILPELLRGGNSAVLDRATIAQNGQLTPPFLYLEDYVNAVEVK